MRPIRALGHLPRLTTTWRPSTAATTAALATISSSTHRCTSSPTTLTLGVVTPPVSLHRQHHRHHQQCRPYHGTALVFDEEGGGGDGGGGEAVAIKTKRKKKDPELKKMAQDFNNRRAAYNRQVSLLRKEYTVEVAQQRAADAAQREAKAREATRRRLERQRQKNITSARNAMLEKQKREARALEFQQHLDREQIKRQARQERYAAARQMVVDELEKEAPLWLTTPQEVEAAFTDEAEQLLWARRGGVLGAPNPSLDAHFWQNETHTWHMTKTYKAQRDVLLQDIRELTYEEANVDAKFWTPERLAEVEDLETRARLRAEVQRAGRLELLRRQAQMINDQYQTKGEEEVPKKIPPPDLKVLSNTRALEREGAKLMFANPTRFFVFDEESQGNMNEQDYDNVGRLAQGEDPETGEYSGPTLGAPIGIRKTNSEKFPQAIGKFPKPDTRTAREKKQEAREERMLAAARAEETTSIELAAEEQDIEDFEPDIDYDNFKWDEDEDEWFKGLGESPEDEEIRKTPPSRRFKPDDIEWVIQKLNEEQHFLEQQFSTDVEAMQHRMRNEFEQQTTDEAEAEATSENDLQSTLVSMPDKELIALSDLDDAYVAASGNLSAMEFSEFAAKIPSLTEDQLRSMLDRDRE